MHKVKKAAIVAVTFVLAATLAQAKALPLPKPNPERGSIAVTMRGRAPAGTKLPAVQVHFVRLGQEVDMFAAASVIPSDFSKKKQVYLLNAEPGRYVAVAAQFRGSAVSNDVYKAFLEKATISQTEIEVTPGRIAFMGDFLIDLKVKMNKSDEAQAHYFRLIEPRAASKGLTARVYFGKYMYRGDLVSADREPATQIEYWTLARDKVFNEAPAWKAKVEEELLKLKPR